MRSYTERAKNFIKEFVSTLDTSSFNDCESQVWKFNVENRRNVRFNYGATRFCFVTSDYVVKVDRTDEYGKRHRKDFGGCTKEYSAYLHCKHECLCPITRYVYNHRCYYIMPRATCVGKTKLLPEDFTFLTLNGFFDLHRGNVGKLNGRPVLIDYAARED